MCAYVQSVMKISSFAVNRALATQLMYDSPSTNLQRESENTIKSFLAHDKYIECAAG